MANYTQLKKGNWKAEESFGYLPNGKQNKIRKQGFRTQKEAIEWVREQTEQQRKGFIQTNANKIIFNDYINKWFIDFKSVGLAPTTKDNYLSRINHHILPFFKDYKLGEINNIAIQDFYNTLIKKDLKPSSVNKCLDILNGVFKYAQKNKLIYISPVNIDKQPLDSPELDVWTKEELDYFLKKVEGQYLHLPAFLASLTGARPGELCGLTWNKVDFVKQEITINIQALTDKKGNVYLTDVLKTRTSKRKITIPKILCNYLSEIKENRNVEETDFIILELSMPNPKIPTKSNNLNANFTKKIKALKKLKNKLSYITFNGLRHTHATLLVQNNVNIKLVSKRLGHKDIATTLKYYTHVTEKMEIDTANLLDNLFT